MFQVFQPLLMEYFTFEELKEIKARVLHLHSVFNEVYKKYTKSHVTYYVIAFRAEVFVLMVTHNTTKNR